MRKICCCTGHRPKGFSWDYEDKTLREHKEYLGYLAYLVEDFIKDGYDWSISGGAIGADMDFAETVIALRERYPHIRLEIAAPCKQQDRKWREADKARYQAICAQADEINVLSPYYTAWCMDRRNRYMVDKADLVLAIWNGRKTGDTYQTQQYAQKKDKQVEYIMLPPVERLSTEDFADYLIEHGGSLEERISKYNGMKRVRERIREKDFE